MDYDINYYKLLLSKGYSLLTVGDEKRPNTPWKELNTKALTLEEFEVRFNKTGANGTKSVGLICGYNNVEVLDIDLKVFETKRERDEFWAEFLNFCESNIDYFMQKFVIKRTKNQGYHILYRCNAIEGNKKLATPKGKKEAIIETRGVSGYVVIYAQSYNDLDYHEIQEVSELDRQILFDIARSYDHTEEVIEIPKKVATAYDNTGLKCWEDFNEKTDIFSIVSDSFEFVRSYKGKNVIRRIGSKNVSSGSIFDNNCMYLFTTGSLYPTGKLISPFVAYAYKYHHGDLSATAKDLYAQGFGSRISKKQIDVAPVERLETQQVEFPIEIYPQFIQNYILECYRTLDSSVDFLGASFLWLLSISIGNSCRVKVKNGWEEPAGIWLGIVGRAGLGKTPAIHNIINPLIKKNGRLLKQYLEKLKEFEAYEKLTKDEKKREIPINQPIRNQFIVNDITLEALVDLCQESDNGVGVFKDELAGWLKDMNKYRQGSDLEFWLSTWSSKTVSITRKTTKNAYVDSPFVPVIGGIQPDILNNFYTDEYKQNGFMDRLLLCNPTLQVEKYNENEMDQELIDNYSALVLSFFDEIQSQLIDRNEHGEIVPKQLTFSKEAKIEWERIFNKITNVQNDDDVNEYFKSMLPKQKSYIPRFALLLELIYTFFHSIENNYRLSNMRFEISKTSILNAEKLSNYFITTAKNIMITAKEVTEIKDAVKTSKGKTAYQKFLDVYEQNPETNKKRLAEVLQISRTQLYRFIDEYDKHKK